MLSPLKAGQTRLEDLSNTFFLNIFSAGLEIGYAFQLTSHRMKQSGTLVFNAD
ncbi:MAG: hypothetical protein QW555_07495 [Nitrososphaerota archaeon]